MFLIIISVLFNYFFSNYLTDTRSFNKKKLLYIGVFLNIFILIIFKYTNFIISNLNEIFNADIILLNLIFPLALSFYTLQQITYLVDRYQNPKIKISLKNIFYTLLFFHN